MDISIIEWIAYGIPAYTGIILLIWSAFHETPTTRSQSIVRAMYLIVSIICVVILSGSGEDITLENGTITTTEYIINGTTGVNLTNSTITATHSSQFTLINPIWILVHYMFAIIMVVYVILQMLTLFTKSQ